MPWSWCGFQGTSESAKRDLRESDRKSSVDSSTRSLYLGLHRALNYDTYQDESKGNEQGGERNRVLGG